jgi:hypothetical protein
MDNAFKEVFFVEINAVKSMGGDSSSFDEPWIFEGIASTPDVDLFNEVVYPESFKNSLDFFKSNGKIFFDHDYAKQNEDWLLKYGFTKDEILSLKAPIGKPLDVELKPEGLYIKGILNKEHPMARLMWEKYLTNSDDNFRDIIGLSIGAKYLGSPRKEYDVKKGKYITYLPDLLLYEVSMTPEPVNPFTKTWASVIKSLAGADQQQEHHVIEPSEVLYDEKSGKLIVKSVITGGDGVIHVFEQVVDVKEDIKNMADDEKVTLKAFPDQEEAEEEPTATETTEGDAEGSEATQEGSAAPAPDLSGLGEGGAPDLGGVPEGGDPLGGGAPTPDPMGGGEAPAGGAGSVLDSLVTGDEGAGGELGSDPMVGDSDASTDMILDKQDTILDLLGQVLDALHGSAMEQSTPAEEQVSSEAPMPSDELLKSFSFDNIRNAVREALTTDNVVKLSEESTRGLGEVIKSVLVDFEDRIVEKLADKLRTETTFVKKSVEASERPVIVNNPGVHIGQVVTKPKEGEIALKSILSLAESDVNISLDTVKSFTSEYMNIVGSTQEAIQKRANVVERALKTLQISEPEFRALIKKAERGQL